MTRECHVRFCEGLAVKVRRSTHPYIPTEEGWLYLAGIKDLFNGELVGYAMSERMTTDLVIQALFRAADRKTGDSGHFYFAEKRTFLFGIDTENSFGCICINRL